jgi:hypothetical protein
VELPVDAGTTSTTALAIQLLHDTERGDTAFPALAGAPVRADAGDQTVSAPEAGNTWR